MNEYDLVIDTEPGIATSNVSLRLADRFVPHKCTGAARRGHIADEQFPVQDVTIVGVDLMQVERVLGRLNRRKVIFGGIASGAWLGVFIGLLLGIFTGGFLAPLVVGIGIGIGMGVVFGLVSTSLPFAASKGTRDFTSSMQLVAGHYDVLCDPKSADRAKSALAKLALV